MTYLNSDTGAVTVDWVVLTAGLVGLGLATMAVVSTGVQDTADDIDDQMQSQLIIASFTPAAAAWVDYTDLKGIWYNDQERIIGLHPITETNINDGFSNNVANMRAVIDGTGANTDQLNAYAELERAVAYYDTANDNDFDLSIAYGTVGGDMASVVAEFEAEYGCVAQSC